MSHHPAPLLLALTLAAAPSLRARADIDPLSTIDLIRITAPGNAPYQADNPNAFVHNRGGVNYEYSIGRFEVTTAQWTEFFNAAYDRPAADRIPFLTPPTFWGAQPTTPNSAGGLRWTVPAGNEMRPVGNISWRMAAIYCNWLCNNKSTDRAAFMNGAYDVSTFGFETGVPNIRFTDQQAHTPGARYWIPTFDELFKASHYDPDGNGPGQPRWWEYNNSSDTPPVYGPPGVLVNSVPAEANAGWDNRNYPGLSQYTVPLGAYPDVQSPWGLLDVAGGTTEWTETVTVSSTGQRYRVYDGSFWGQDSLQAQIDDDTSTGGEEFPHVPTLEFGFRIASSIPAPGTSAVGLMTLSLVGVRRRRRAIRHTARLTNVPAVRPAHHLAPVAALGLAVAALAQQSTADIDPLSTVDLIRITAPGNAPYQADNPNAFVHNRGGVNYEYSIGRFEVTTAQWTEFFNAAYDRPVNDRIPWLIPPDHWGASPTTPNTAGGLRWTVPAGNGMRPVGDISWRMAAIYCNWLHNGKSTDRNAFLNGAYDVSTFGPRPNQPGFGDQETHNPDARYWIPTWDELLKASHYDPDKDGPGHGGWWVWNNGTDQFSTAGPPGVGQANYGFFSPSPFTIPLGAYPDVQSPWGLHDTAGATSEWAEEIIEIDGGQRFRLFKGSYWTSSTGTGVLDAIYSRGGEFPDIATLEHGFRIASSVPGPSTAMLCLSACALLGRRPRPRSARPH